MLEHVSAVRINFGFSGPWAGHPWRVRSLRRILIALLVASFGALSAVALVACDEEDEVEQVELSLTETDLSPGRVAVESGEIEFVVKNDGKRVHAFAVDSPDGVERTKNIKPGETARVTVDLPVGRYRMYDPRGDFRRRGVRGTIVVTADGEDTVTERTVTERTIEEETAEPPPEEDEPVTVTERQVQPAPRTPPSTPPPTVTQTVPVEPPPASPPTSP